MLQFGGGKPPILTSHDGAEIGGGKLDLDIFGAVLRQEPDAIAVAHALAVERGGKTHHALVERAVRAPRAALLDRHGVRIALNLRGEQFIDAEPAGPANVGGTRLACAGLSVLHIAALISPPSPKRIDASALSLTKARPSPLMKIIHHTMTPRKLL